MKMNSLQRLFGKSKSFLLLLLLTALLAPARMWGQQQQYLDVCLSTGSTGYTGIPFYGPSSNYLSESQFIYSSDILENMVGSNIERIRFKEGNSHSGEYATFDGAYEVYMCVVDYTEFTDPATIDWNGKTKVYTGSLTINFASSFNDCIIDLDVPFYYAGGNLLIGVKQTKPKSTNMSLTWMGAFYDIFSSPSVSKGSTANPRVSNFMPETRFMYRKGSNMEFPVPIPLDLTATVTGGHSATISWQGNSNVNSWQLVCSEVPLTTDVLYGEDLPENTITVEGTSYDLEGLDLGTTYYVYVRGENGTDYSLWSGVSFTTEDYYCEISYQLQDRYGDGWDGNAINVVDENNEVLATWTIEDGNYSEGTLLLQDEKTCRFVWVYGGENSYPEECFFTLFGPDGSIIASIVAPNAEDFEDGELIATYTMNCSALHVPVNLSVNNITMTSAVATWEQGGEENSWNVRFGNPDDWTTIEGIEETTCPLENLTSGTTYQLQVQAVVDGIQSQWASIEFTTTFCSPEDQCNITYTLGLSNTEYDVCWYGDILQVVHSNTNVVVGEITFVEDGPTSGELGLCNGEDYSLVWVDNYGTENATFTVMGPDGSVIATAQHTPNVGFIASFTMDCNACRVPTNVNVTDITTSSATVTWEQGGEETEWLVSYRNANAQGAVVLDESNWTSLPVGWAAFVPNAQFDGLEPITTDWIVDDGALVSNQMSLLFIPVTFGGQAVITVQGNENEAILAGIYSGSLDEIELANLYPSVQIDLLGTTQSISIDLDGNEGTGYLFLYHAFEGDPENLYLEQLVVYGAAEWQESILVTGTPSYTIENLETGNTYQVQVQSICGEDDYSNPAQVSFSTPFCNIENQCPITYVFYDSFGDGWNDGSISVMSDGVLVASLTMDNGSEYSGDLALCPGDYEFVWNPGEYDSECSFTIYDLDGEVILAHEQGYTFSDDGMLGYYTHACPAIFTFIAEGGWDMPSNWDQNALPQAVNNVVINAAAVIPDGYVAEANYITINAGGSLLIEDGGQLKHKNAGVVATVEKVIGGYTVADGNGNYGVTDGWYLIASPMANNVQPSEVTDMITAQQQDFDLFRYNKDAEEGFTWENYKQGHFTTLEPLQGYLYANHYGTTLKYTGEINPIDDDSHIITIPDEVGYYLIGNPLVCDGYPQYYDSWYNCWYNLPYYRMNENQKELIVEAIKGAVLPGEGIFVEQLGKPLSLDVKFFTEYGFDPKKGAIMLNLTKACNTLDRAIVRFGEGPTLGKLMLNPANTKVCIPQGGEEYALVRSACEGEMPINFKAATNGSYTLNVSTHEVDLECLHLIDNLTGADVDLLENPNYTFDAKTTDYASRFKLVFKTKEDGSVTSSGNFAYFDGNSWMVSNIGDATLQVVDMMGRLLVSEQINGNAETHIEAATGVYMMRLINGSDIKVQKIIIK